MSPWLEDYTTASLDDLLQSQAENRLWSKELRRKSSALVNSRLAKDISQEDYLANRKLAQDEAVECRCRASILDAQVMRHTANPRTRER